MRFIDCHMHLGDRRLSGRTETILAGARRAGVEGLLNCAAEEADWPGVLASADHAGPPRITPFLGLHPWYAHRVAPLWLERLESLATAAPCGIGEIGLDYAREGLDRAAQATAFTVQLDLAARLGRPVAIHAVGPCWADLGDTLRRAPRLPPTLMLHAYGGSAELAAELINLGELYLSFTGNLADPRRKRAREAARHLPPDRLLCESDCPDMPPPWARDEPERPRANGRPISLPADLPRTVTALAALRGDDPDELAATLAANAERFLTPLKSDTPPS